MEPLKDLLRTNCFIIPANQRAYSWRKNHAQALLDDLEFLEDTSSHYCGPIIVTPADPKHVRDDRSHDHIARYILEDGQQRLTTCLLLIKILLERYKELGLEVDDNARDLSRYLSYHDQSSRLRISNENKDLDQYLRFLVCGDSEPRKRTSAMRAMDEVWKHFRSHVKPMSSDRLRDLTRQLTSQAKFMLVDLGEDDIDRYLAFDAINSRGLSLSEFDKIKNYCALLSCRRDGLTFAAETQWYLSLVELEKYDVSSRAWETTFIAEAYSVFFDSKTGQESVHAAFVKRFNLLLREDKKALQDELSGFVTDWIECAKAFAFVASDKRQTVAPAAATSTAFRYLTCIDYMGMPAIMRPVLCAGFLRFNKAEFETVCRWSEIYTFRVYGFVPRRVDQGKKEINRLAHEILQLGLTAEKVGQRLCSWMDTLCPAATAFKFLSDGEAKYSYDRRVRGWSHCYYFLYQYELSESPAGTEPVPWVAKVAERKESIEHIMPQTRSATGWWESHWPDAGEAEKFKHRFGNLVLSNGNEILGRKEFRLKLEDPTADYFYRHADATCSEKRIESFTDGSNWRAEEILRREASMIRFAMERWSMGCCSENGAYELPVIFEGVFDDEAERTIRVSWDDCIASGTPDPNIPPPSNSDDEVADSEGLSDDPTEEEDGEGTDQNTIEKSNAIQI